MSDTVFKEVSVFHDGKNGLAKQIFKYFIDNGRSVSQGIAKDPENPDYDRIFLSYETEKDAKIDRWAAGKRFHGKLTWH